jgi:hypothetical protein
MENKYLVKIAEYYNVAPHSMDRRILDVKNVTLNKHELKKFEEEKNKHFHPGHALGSLLAGGGVGAIAGHHLAGRLGGYIGGAAGAMTGVNAYLGRGRDKAMEDAGYAATSHIYKD